MTREVETGSPVIDQFPAFEDDGFSKRPGLSLPSDFVPTVYRDGAVVATAVAITPVVGDLGSYKIVWTPSANGFHEVHVHIIFNGEIRYARYKSVTELTNTVATEARDQAKKIDQTVIDVPPTDGSLADYLANKDAGQTYSPALHSLEAIADAVVAGNATLGASLAQVQADLLRVLGLLHRNAILDRQAYDGQSQLTFARLRVFDSPGNVPAAPDGNETVGLLHEYTIDTEYAGLNIVEKFTLKQNL